MRVLFTNIQLNHRTGTEVVIRDLALGMRTRGHDVAVYTPHPGPIADELIADGIPVVERIENVPFRPDVVHGHHHSPTVEALTHFYDTPAIWVCHDRFQYQDIPPRHPGIGRYVAVDLNCRERLIIEAGIAEDRVRLVHNAVDLERVQRRPRLPNAIGRAAVFSNSAKPGGYLDVVAEVCNKLEIPLDVIGDGSGASSDTPERLLGHYDLVFAKARCALEALAAGCAVLLIDHVGMGPIVTTQNMMLLRDWNFGARCLQGSPTPERLASELDLFDPEDASSVTDWIRSVASLGTSLDQYSALYNQAVDLGSAGHTRLVLSPTETALEYAATLEQRMRLLQVPVHAVALPETIASDVHLRVFDSKRRVHPGSTFGVEVAVTNRSKETLASLAPFPVLLSYHWICPGDRLSELVEGGRTLLSRPLYPGASSRERISVEAPAIPGTYVLRLTLVQESVFWFDELSPPIAGWLTVEVGGRTDDQGSQAPTMALSALTLALSSLPIDAEVVRDGAFCDLGFVNDNGEQMLVFAGSPRFVGRAVDNPGVTCIVTTSDLVDLIPPDRGVLIAADPKEAFFRLHNWLAESTGFFTEDRESTIAQSATIHASAWIDPRGVHIDEECVIGPNVVIHGPATLGRHTMVDAGAVIGSSAFQTSARSGSYVELRHVGGVSIGSDCHVYSNASISRGVFRASTEIGDRCQIGNGAFVSHQCRLGHNVFVGHNATVNGRVVVGNDVWIGPGTVISNELTIGDGARIALGSTVMHDVPERGRVSGMPALDQQVMFRHSTTVRGKRR